MNSHAHSDKITVNGHARVIGKGTNTAVSKASPERRIGGERKLVNKLTK